MVRAPTSGQLAASPATAAPPARDRVPDIPATSFGPETERLVDELLQRRERRRWAAIMLALSREVCRSILLGRPVMARGLDAEALRRALRGGSLPPPDEYVVVTREMLDAVAEAGPFVPRRSRP